MEVKQLEANYIQDFISVIGILEIINQLTSYSVKVYNTIDNQLQSGIATPLNPSLLHGFIGLHASSIINGLNDSHSVYLRVMLMAVILRVATLHVHGQLLHKL